MLAVSSGVMGLRMTFHTSKFVTGRGSVSEGLGVLVCLPKFGAAERTPRHLDCQALLL